MSRLKVFDGTSWVPVDEAAWTNPPSGLIASEAKAVRDAIAAMKASTVAAKTASYTATADDDQAVLLFNGSNLTLTLPDITSTLQGKYGLWVLNAHTTDLTIDGNGSDTIDGSAEYDLESGTGVYLFAITGTSWAILCTSGGGSGAGVDYEVRNKSGNQTLTAADAGIGRLVRFTAGTGAWDSGIDLPSAITDPQGIAVKSNGDVVVSDNGTRKVYTYDKSAGTWDSGIAGPSNASENTLYGVAVKSNGNILACAAFGFNVRVYERVGSSWTNPIIVAVKLHGLAVKSNGDIVGVDKDNDRIYTYANNAWTSFTISINNPDVRGISVLSNGNLLVPLYAGSGLYSWNGSAWSYYKSVPSAADENQDVAVQC